MTLTTKKMEKALRDALMKLAIVLLTAFSAGGCQNKQTRYRVMFITDQSWTVGEARTCSFVDEKRDVMRCATPSKGSSETLTSREYLVDADFNKKPPVPEEPGGWYGIVCRLDSFAHATCQVE